MTAGLRAAAFAAIVLAAGCGGGDEERRRVPSDPELRIWAPIVVRWEAGRARRVEFAIENPTNRTIEIAAPDQANARVDVYSGPEPNRVCGVAPGRAAAPGARVALAPGDRVEVEVDLEAACRDVPPGEYRYEVSYRAAALADANAGTTAPKAGAEAGPKAFSGTLPVQYGQVVVSGPAPSGSADAVSRGDPDAGPAAQRQGRAEPPQRRARRSPAPDAAAPEGRR